MIMNEKREEEEEKREQMRKQKKSPDEDFETTANSFVSVELTSLGVVHDFSTALIFFSESWVILSIGI